ncbi:MAG: asparagine synthase (glutamine-hydrolyzing) [Candidatus Aureabacteria bacterium]|nr:asparagine synthase (glutamine-hydrolyzing) [Candidatus Auribacterota bacterium]
MCGICGFTSKNKSVEEKNTVIRNMAEAMRHRGPDAEGYHIDEDICLGHRRLSIIDLETGDQPMFNEDRSLILVFNGEIYNYKELRKDLIENGHKFKTNSDSEVILHLYEEKGKECVKSLNGMFAFAIWNTKKKKLFLARDRFGQKPLFYAIRNNNIIFASELHSLTKYPGIETIMDDLSLLQYFAYEYVPEPRSIFKKVFKLPAGHFGVFSENKISIKKYWDYLSDKNECNNLSIPEASERLLDLLSKSVSRRLISDVPLGIFLSGGIDSSAIAALAVKNCNTKIKTFSISFKEPTFDESAYAAKIAKYLGTEHYEKVFDSKELLNIIDPVLGEIDEPLADSSLLATSLLSEFTKNHVTVALGGDGSDELLCGYPTFNANFLAKFYQYLPGWLHKNIILNIINKIPPNFSNQSLEFQVKQFLKGARKKDQQRLQYWLGAFTYEEMDEMCEPELINKFSKRDIYNKININSLKNNIDDVNIFSYSYIKTYLNGDILTKVDRSSMKHSLEVRSPFLDMDLVKFISILPGKMKYNKFVGKRILKEALRGIVPEEIIGRKKKGFSVPVGKWLNNELREHIEDKTFEESLIPLGIRKKYVAKIVKQHLSRNKNNRKALWSLLVLSKWIGKNRN